MTHELKLLHKISKLHNIKYSEINDQIIRNTIKRINIDTDHINELLKYIKLFNNQSYEQLFRKIIKQKIIHNRSINILCKIKKHNLISNQLFKQLLEKTYITEYDELQIIFPYINTEYTLIIADTIKESFVKMCDKYKITYGKNISNLYQYITINL